VQHGGLASGAIPGPDFFVRTVPWFHGERLRDTSHRTMRSIERRQFRGIELTAIMSLDEPRPRGTTYGLRITKARCRIRRKIKRNSATRSSARARECTGSVWSV
jgi:hypothetical protein